MSPFPTKTSQIGLAMAFWGCPQCPQMLIIWTYLPKNSSSTVILQGLRQSDSGLTLGLVGGGLLTPVACGRATDPPGNPLTVNLRVKQQLGLFGLSDSPSSKQKISAPRTPGVHEFGKPRREGGQNKRSGSKPTKTEITPTSR